MHRLKKVVHFFPRWFSKSFNRDGIRWLGLVYCRRRIRLLCRLPHLYYVVKWSSLGLLTAIATLIITDLFSLVANILVHILHHYPASFRTEELVLLRYLLQWYQLNRVRQCLINIRIEIVFILLLASLLSFLSNLRQWLFFRKLHSVRVVLNDGLAWIKSVLIDDRLTKSFLMSNKAIGASWRCVEEVIPYVE